MSRGFSRSSAFSAREGGSKGDYATPSNTKLGEKNLRSVEKRLKDWPADNPNEGGAAIGADGKVLFNIKDSGKSKMVAWTLDMIEKVKAQGGRAVFTHNHPSGASFSAQDVAMLFVGNLQEVRAVAGDVTFSLSDPDGVIRKKFDIQGILTGEYYPNGIPKKEHYLMAKDDPDVVISITKLWDLEKNLNAPFVREMMRAKYGRFDIEEVKRTPALAREYSQELSHMMMEEVADQLGLVYKRFPSSP